MARLILLDAGPLGMAANARSTPTTVRATHWLRLLLANDASVGIPEVADYEVRRELLRARRETSVAVLDDLGEGLLYFPIATRTMLCAAEFWA